MKAAHVPRRNLLKLFPSPDLGAAIIAAALVCASAGPTHAQTEKPDDPNYRQAANNALPLTPEMIFELRKRFDDGQKAKEALGRSRRSRGALRQRLFGPGGAVNIVQAVQGYPSAIAFVDSTGQP